MVPSESKGNTVRMATSNAEAAPATVSGKLAAMCDHWGQPGKVGGRRLTREPGDYNMTITAVAVVVAVVIGGIEILGLIGDTWDLAGPFWNAIGSLNDNFGVLGYIIIGIFAVSWLGSSADLPRQGLWQS
jgi:High-affinity nickel-transport protein